MARRPPEREQISLDRGRRTTQLMRDSLDRALDHSMHLRFHDGREIASPDEKAIDDAFNSLSDPGDFLILRDPARGEVRAAGPRKDTFLLQCDVPAPGGTFRGEVYDLKRAEAVAIFKAVRGGDATWTSRFRSLDAPLSPTIRRILVSIAMALAALLALYLLRAV